MDSNESSAEVSSTTDGFPAPAQQNDQNSQIYYDCVHLLNVAANGNRMYYFSFYRRGANGERITLPVLAGKVTQVNPSDYQGVPTDTILYKLEVKLDQIEKWTAVLEQ